ncbi:MAG TPA: SapC family protein [Gammaproteobacteria bacterium]|nr:SapC family protein [Gammaproteobacteria bacterium]
MSTPSPLFYQNIVPLNANTHKNLYLDTSGDFKFAKKTNSVYIAHVEFLKASKEYPIVFAMDKEKAIYPVVLLGLDKDQNLFVDSKGKWSANYIPAYVRRYPFILASNPGGDGNFTICIDDKFAGLNTSKKGEKLFDKEGAHTEQLKRSIEFLKEYNRHTQVTTAFCIKLKELNILEPMKLSMKTNEGKEISMGGFSGINRKKFKQLPAETVAELFKNDYLELMYLHLASLSNVETLMQRLD